MQCTAVAPKAKAPAKPTTQLRVIDHVERPNVTTVHYDADTALSVSCFAGANFCRCWMPAWFQLAEIVAKEHRAAGG